MEKVLIAMNETTFSEGAFSFARQLAFEQPSLLTGVFLPDDTRNANWKRSEDSIYLYGPFMDQQREIMENNIIQFRNLCQNNGLEFRLHTGYFNAILPELQHESRFADLLILSSEKFYGNLHDHESLALLESVLCTAACPVVVVPESFAFPQKNVLLYNGSASSVYAIKQFAYLFPAWCKKPTSIVYMNEEEGDELPEELAFAEWVNHHFTQPSFVRMHVDPRHFLISWAEEQKNSIIVSGAFGRPFLSRILHKSFITDLIAEHKLPVFIAHRSK